MGTLSCRMAVLLALCKPQVHHVDEGCRALGQQLHIPAHLWSGPVGGWQARGRGATEGRPGLSLSG